MIVETGSGGFLAREIKNQGGGAPATSRAARISPAVLFVVVILAVVVFVSGLLHLLVRFLLRRRRRRALAGDSEVAAASGGEEAALQRQLQQLFHLHDAGLDQAVIDSLPVFLYREVVGAKEPFDCAVCLCEFAGDDRLRLLPLCGHAFHIDCIDTWLLSNSTCPLCRGALVAPGLAADYPAFDELDELAEDDAKPHEDAVLPVRLGKFKNLGRRDFPAGEGGAAAAIAERDEGETSSSSLDARRCFSMGSYQYVLAEASLQVSVHRRAVRARGLGANPASNEALEGKKIHAGSKGDSFSVSKIWQWRSDAGKLSALAPGGSAAADGGFPWTRRSAGTVLDTRNGI